MTSYAEHGVTSPVRAATRPDEAINQAREYLIPTAANCSWELPNAIAVQMKITPDELVCYWRVRSSELVIKMALLLLVIWCKTTSKQGWNVREVVLSYFPVKEMAHLNHVI